MKNSRKRLLAAVLTLVMVFTAAIPFASAEGEKKLTVGIYGGLDSLNPWTSGRITKDMVTYVLYETLASCQNGSTEIDPILMKSYEQVDDTTFSVEIYDYIKDAAGNPITASDVAFSFNQYNQYWATTLDTITPTGDYTFDLKLTTTAAGAFNYIVCKVPIASEKAFNESPDGFASTSCGTMPYTVAGGSDYVAGTSIILRKTGEYWQTVLKESGYNGETIRLLCNSNATITNMWLTVQAYLMQIGINAELNVVEGTTYGSYRDGTSGQYEMAYAGPGNGGYVTSDLWNTLFNRNNYASGATWAGLKDDTLQSLYDAIAAPGGYTQENLNAFYDYITENALYYQIYSLPEYAAISNTTISGWFTDWNRFIRANTFELK